MRPSALLGVVDPYAAYCLDNAVGEFGRTVDAELEAVEGKTKRELKTKTTRVLQKWLDIPLQYRGPSREQIKQLPGRDGDS